MTFSQANDTNYDDVRDFVFEVVRSGLMLTEVLGVLLDEFPDDAFPGEEPIDVLLDMLTGTFLPAAAAVGGTSVLEATALLGALCDRALSDLRTAAELASRGGHS